MGNYTKIIFFIFSYSFPKSHLTTSVRKPIICLKEPFITVTIFLLTFGLRKNFKMDVRFLTFNLIKSGL